MKKNEDNEKQSLSKDVMVFSFIGIFLVGIGYSAGLKQYAGLLIGIFSFLIVGSFFLGYLLPVFLTLSKVKKVITVSFLVLISGFSFWYFLGSDMLLANKESLIDDYLNKYKWEEAREINSSMVDSIRNKNLKKITMKESSYWANEKNYEKALSIVDESSDIPNEIWYDEEWEEFKYDIINKAVTNYCENDNYNQAKIFAMKAADDRLVDGSSFNRRNVEDINAENYPNMKARELRELVLDIKTENDKSMRQTLLIFISTYEKMKK